MARRYDRFGRPNPRGRYGKRRAPGGARRTVLYRLPTRAKPDLPAVVGEGAAGRVERFTVRDRRERSVLGTYWNRVRQFVETGDERSLRKIRRVTFVDSSGRRHRLITDPATLRILALQGALDFDDFYP